MSHSVAIHNALNSDQTARTTYLNFGLTPELLCADTDNVNFDLFPPQKPDLVLLAIGGNAHNFIGMFEHPTPFSIGHETLGVVPDDPARHFIPRDAMEAFFDEKLANMFNHANQIHAHYPDVPFVYISAPPPIGDEAHIRAFPSKFEKMMHLGFAPPALRRALFDVQCAAYRKQAAKHGAAFLLPPPQAVCSEGFLDTAYTVSDPTHANLAYGMLVLGQLNLLRGEAA